VIRLVSNMPVQGMVGAARAGARQREAAAQLGREEGSPGIFLIIVVVIIAVNPRTARASM
jgi:hypothetical protein